MKRLLIAVLMVGLMAMPAFAAVQNIKVSGSIDSTWIVRDQFDLGVGPTIGTQSQYYQNLLITQAILRVDADLTDNVSAVIELINEREWGNEGTRAGADDDDLTTDIGINMAYVTLREMLYSPLTVMVGRQPLRYGNALIIGDLDTNNASVERLNVVADDFSKRKTFDAVKMVFDYDPLTIDIFAAKVDSNDVTGRADDTTNSEDDIDLYGAVANWKLGDEYNTEVEGYFFAEIDNDVQEDNTPGQKRSSIYCPGLRVASSPIEGLYTSAEIAWQAGNFVIVRGENDNQPRDAMAIQLISNYAIPIESIAKYDVVVSGSYTMVTGDSNPANTLAEPEASENRMTAWDPMYEDQGGGTIYNTLFNFSNFHAYGTTIQATPLEDITAKLSWTTLYLDKEFDEAAPTTTWARTLPDGSAVVWNVVAEEINLGSELDLDIVYDYTEDVQLGFSCGWFFPGDVFAEFNDDVAKQFITSVDVAF